MQSLCTWCHGRVNNILYPWICGHEHTLLYQMVSCIDNPRHMKVHSFMAFSDCEVCHLGNCIVAEVKDEHIENHWGIKVYIFQIVITTDVVSFLMHPKYSRLNSISSPLAMMVAKLLYWVSRFCKSTSKAVTDLKARWPWRVQQDLLGGQYVVREYALRVINWFEVKRRCHYRPPTSNGW